MSQRHLSLFFGLWLATVCGVAHPGAGFAQTQAPAQTADQIRTEIPYRDGIVILTSHEQHSEGKIYHASGNVRIAFKEIVITCDAADYNEETHEGTTSGKTRLTQNKQWIECSHSEFNVEKDTATLYDAKGYTDDEFLVQGKVVIKLGRDNYQVKEGSLTSCKEERPNWMFGIGNANIRVDQTAHLHRVLFKIKDIPVLYLPYLAVPLENKKRSSGFLPFHTGTSTSKGRQFRLGYYQPLGASADATVYGDYYSLRGYGIGGIFRARPNEQTRLDIQAYGVNDRLNQGGAHLLIDGETLFQNGFRAAAKVNVTTNFQFRQAFSEGFRSATIPEEQMLVFATRSSGSFSTDFSFERNEVYFPIRPLVIRKSPSMEIVSLGQRLGKLPLIFYLRAAAEGLARTDSEIETPRIVQRLDLFPRLALRLPSFAGFSLMPSFGIRETYYSARLSDDSQPSVVPTPLRRQYTDLEIDLRTPQLEKTFHWQGLGDFRHLVEPVITYRRIHGITELPDTIRFDENDAIADTNELEYGVVNRIMRRREIRPGVTQDYEFLSLEVAQKYFFDPTFGGAFVPGQSNSFYPLDTLTGFFSTGMERTLSPTTISLRLTPAPAVGYDLQADYDTKLARLRDTSFSAFWQHDDELFFAGTYVKTNALESSMFSADHIQGQLRYGNLSKMRGPTASVTLSYNIQTRTLLNSSWRVSYGWNCCGVSVEFQQYDLGLRNESRFSFSFTLKGIGSFGNIKHPESLF